MRRFVGLGLLLTIIVSLVACTPVAQTNPGETDIPVVTKTDENLICGSGSSVS